MAKLHQILAILNGTQNETTRLLNLAVQGLGVTGEQSPLSGISITYEPRDADGDPLPPKYQQVQIKVEHDVLPMIADAFSKMLDVNYTREQGNTQARADVVVDRQIVLPGVPATYLLTLENKLGELRTLLAQLPVLDPAEDWAWDTNRNCYTSRERERARSIPVPQVQVLYEAKIEGGVGIPAQVRPYEVQKPVGDYTEIRFSGAMPAEKREAMLRRLNKLAEAVKFAREEANRIDVDDMVAGKAVFDFIYGTGVASPSSTASSSS